MKILYFILGFIKGIASGGGGGGAAVDPVYTVTFMSWDGSEVIGQRSVVDGDDCADMVARGEWPTPTRESTDQYNYTYAGWSKTSGGAASSSALSAVTADRTVYAAFTSAVRYYTITYYDGDTLLKSESLAYGAMPSYTPIKDGFTFQYWEPELAVVTGDATYYAQFIEKITLAGSSWARIAEISAAGLGASYFALGDSKPIELNGTVGTSDVSSTEYSVFILAFDHNSEIEGSGITFGTFIKNGATYPMQVLIDSNYNDRDTNGTKYFSICHWSQYTYGGWPGCDLRYDILGSTDEAPSEYGSAPTSKRVGYNPSSTCATTPVSNTLMAALPADLRAVMKPITKYTNKADGYTVEASIDYLPLLSEFEVFGVETYSKGKNQKQYDYYASGNSTIKYANNLTFNVSWWLRSAREGSKNNFCYVHNGKSSTNYPYYSYGLSPVFLI